MNSRVNVFLLLRPRARSRYRRNVTEWTPRERINALRAALGGRDELRGKLRRMRRTLAIRRDRGELRKRLTRLHAIGLIEVTAKRGDKTLTYRTAEVYHMRDGKITERWTFSDDTEAIKRFFE